MIQILKIILHSQLNCISKYRKNAINIYNKALNFGIRLTYRLYERNIAVYLSTQFPLLNFIQNQILKHYSVVLVCNIGEAAGHIISDLDHFLQLKHRNRLDPNKRYWWVQKPRDDSTAIKRLYGDSFDKCMVSHLAYIFFLPVILNRSSPVLDVGLSRLKHHLSQYMDITAVPCYSPPFNSQISKWDGFQQWVAYYRLRKENMPLRPLARNEIWHLPKMLKALLAADDRPLALIHLRFRNGTNATAERTDPDTYSAVLGHLNAKGFRIVLVGREEMPPQFDEFGVINYSQSEFANYENDLKIFSRAKFVLTAGSGISLLADVLHTPAVYANYWHLNMCMFSPNCVLLPSLVNHTNGSPLTFREQISLYMDRIDKGPENFPEGEFLVRNANGEEILSAAQEALEIAEKSRPLSHLQEKFSALEPDGMMGASLSRVGDLFIRGHKQRFD